MKSKVKMTREEWLTKLTDKHLRDLFAKSGAKIPLKLRISCGWPSSRALGKKLRTVGQCWSPTASADKTTEIFISPVLQDAVEVAAVLVHELVHGAVGNEAGHGPIFKELAKSVGLVGPMRSTEAGEWLKTFLAAAIKDVGSYPHATLDMSQVKKQSTRLLKVCCPNPECDFLLENEKPYSVRMSAGVYDAGSPRCGVCEMMMEV